MLHHDDVQPRQVLASNQDDPRFSDDTPTQYASDPGGWFADPYLWLTCTIDAVADRIQMALIDSVD
jgi:hypothetical protein